MYRSQGGDHYDKLEPFFDQGYLEGDILGVVKTGKEASVYLCEGGPASGESLVAAKIFRGRQYRFKNDAVYQQARSRELGIRGRDLRAMQTRGSAHGRDVSEGTWKYREFETLQLLHEMGAAVPRPITAAGDVLLMQYFGDEDSAADQLIRVHLEPHDADRFFRQVMRNVEMFLRANRVHGDLSPHNILYWQGEIVIIDFPQATDPRFNDSARDLLIRDVENVCRYFNQFGVEANAAIIADDLWRRFMLAML